MENVFLIAFVLFIAYKIFTGGGCQGWYRRLVSGLGSVHDHAVSQLGCQIS